MNIKEIIQENSRRLRALETDFDPVRGIGCSGERIEVATPVEGLPRAFVPREMTDDPQYAVATGAEQWKTLRYRHDFEYWCVTCVRVKHKTLGTDVAFRLNRPQRRVAAVMEADRRAGRPIRLIMLKARQWGGSTLVQMYMAWIQSCHRRNWHSLICAHVKDTAAGIRGMYTKMLADYPEDLWEGDERPMFRPYERSLNVREITGRGCRVTVGSAENHEAVRGSDYAMAHLSETAFWPSTPQHTPEGLVRAVCGSIALMPYSLIVMESTANGIGNYFHSEWLRCRDGHGDKRAVFVPWYEIELYSVPVDDPEALITSMSPYERSLWNMGLTLEQIYWYRLKSSEYLSHEMMMAEFPTTDTEAFAATGSGVFDPADVERLRGDCREPLMTADADSSRSSKTLPAACRYGRNPTTKPNTSPPSMSADARSRATGRSSPSCAAARACAVTRSSPSGADISTTTVWPPNAPPSGDSTTTPCSSSRATPSNARPTAEPTRTSSSSAAWPRPTDTSTAARPSTATAVPRSASASTPTARPKPPSSPDSSKPSATAPTPSATPGPATSSSPTNSAATAHTAPAQASTTTSS